MSELTYPILCQSCGKQLYGPVTYCPYCAAPCAVASAKEASENAPHIEQVTDDTVTQVSEPVSVHQPLPLQTETAPECTPTETQKVEPEVKRPDVKSEPVAEKKTGKPKEELVQPEITSPKPSGNLKWVAVAIVVIVCIAGYLVTQKKRGAAGDQSAPQPMSSSSSQNQNNTGVSVETSTPRTISSPSAPSQGKKDSARIIAQDALRQGTGLSLTISKLPKLQKVLQAAKQLGDISPRYQEQIASAESTVSSARASRDKSLLAYIGKVVELGRYTPDQVSYAMGVVQGGDISPREKIVIELLSGHVNALRTSTKVDSAKVLKEFSGRFTDFVD